MTIIDFPSGESIQFPSVFVRNLTSGAAVAQPAFEPSRPHMALPPKVYQALFGVSDEELTARLSETEPPVKAVA